MRIPAWFLISVLLSGRGSASAIETSAGANTNAVPAFSHGVIAALGLQAQALLPALGNPEVMANTLLNLSSPRAPSVNNADSITAALVLKRALIEPAAYSAVQRSIAREPSPVIQSLSKNLTDLKESIQGKTDAKKIFQQTFEPLEEALGSNPSLAQLNTGLDNFWTGSKVPSDRPNGESFVSGAEGSASHNAKILVRLTPFSAHSTLSRKNPPTPESTHSDPINFLLRNILAAAPDDKKAIFDASLRKVLLAAKRYRLDQKPAVEYVVDRVTRLKSINYDKEFLIKGNSSLTDGALTISIDIVSKKPTRPEGGSSLSRFLSGLMTAPTPDHPQPLAARILFRLIQMGSAHLPPDLMMRYAYSPPGETRLAYAELIYGVLKAASLKAAADTSIRRVRIQGTKVINGALRREFSELGFIVVPVPSKLGGGDNYVLDIPIRMNSAVQSGR